MLGFLIRQPFLASLYQHNFRRISPGGKGPIPLTNAQPGLNIDVPMFSHQMWPQTMACCHYRFECTHTYADPDSHKVFKSGGTCSDHLVQIPLPNTSNHI